MADSKLSDLTASSALTGTELFYSDNGSADVKVTATQLKTLAVGAGSVSVTIGKTFTASNTLTLTGTDGSSVVFGTGGTVLYNGGALGTPSSATLTNATGLPISTGVSGLGTGVATAAGNAVNGTGGFITYATFAPASGKTLTVSNSITLAGTDSTTMTFPSTSTTLAGLGIANTFTASQTISGASFTISGNISSTAWTTSGIRYKSVAATLTDTSSSGTVAAAYTNVYGGNTIAASNSTTFTKYVTTWINGPTAGTNVTMTTKYALGLSGSLECTGQIVTPTITLTDGTNIAWDVDTGAIAKVTLGGNRTLSAPTNLRDGGTYVLRVIQDGTGNRTLAYNAVFKWPGGIAPVLSTGANAIDILTFVSDGTNLYGSIQQAFA